MHERQGHGSPLFVCHANCSRPIWACYLNRDLCNDAAALSAGLDWESGSAIGRNGCFEGIELWVQALVVIVATSLRLEASREAKPKVIVAERRIELTAERDAADGVRVAPRSAARGASHALVGARGIPLR